MPQYSTVIHHLSCWLRLKPIPVPIDWSYLLLRIPTWLRIDLYILFPERCVWRTPRYRTMSYYWILLSKHINPNWESDWPQPTVSFSWLSLCLTIRSVPDSCPGLRIGYSDWCPTYSALFSPVRDDNSKLCHYGFLTHPYWIFTHKSSYRMLLFFLPPKRARESFLQYSVGRTETTTLQEA